MQMCSSDYSRIQSVLMLQPTCGLFQGFIVNHRDRNREAALGRRGLLLIHFYTRLLRCPSLFQRHTSQLWKRDGLLNRMYAMTDGCNHKKTGAGATHSFSNTFERLGWCSGFSSVHKNLPVFLPRAAGCLQKDAFKSRTNEFEVSSLVFCFFYAAG